MGNTYKDIRRERMKHNAYLKWSRELPARATHLQHEHKHAYIRHTPFQFAGHELTCSPARERANAQNMIVGGGGEKGREGGMAGGNVAVFAFGYCFHLLK